MISRIVDSLRWRLSFIPPLIAPVANVIKAQFSKRHIRQLLKEKQELCIEIGAGDKKGKNGWLTIDIAPNCDIYWDLRNGLPFPDASISKIYSSHLFEHLTFEEGQLLLNECKRALMPGGTFSICVPNARLYIDAYLQAGALDQTRIFKPAFNRTTAIDYVNYMAYMAGHHKYMFDQENLLYLLKAKGFREVRQRAFDPGLDRQERDFESIYAEAVK